MAALVLSTVSLEGAVAVQEVGKSKAVPARAGSGGPSMNDLKPENFEILHKVILPQKNEWVWDRVRWVCDVWHARRRAAEEDKPILIMGNSGAGYNNNLGLC